MKSKKHFYIFAFFFMSTILLYRAYSFNIKTTLIQKESLSPNKMEQIKTEDLTKKYIEETFGYKISDKLFYISDKIKSIFRIS